MKWVSKPKSDKRIFRGGSEFEFYKNNDFIVLYVDGKEAGKFGYDEEVLNYEYGVSKKVYGAIKNPFYNGVHNNHEVEEQKDKRGRVYISNSKFKQMFRNNEEMAENLENIYVEMERTNNHLEKIAESLSDLCGLKAYYIKSQYEKNKEAIEKMRRKTVNYE